MKPLDLKKGIKIYTWIIIALLAVLCIRLAIVQLFYNDIYQTQAKENSLRLVSIKPPRGEIYASQDEILAANELVYTLNFSPVGVQNQEEVITKLVEKVNKYYPNLSVESIIEKVEMQQIRLYESVVIMRDISWDLVVELEENRQDYPGVNISVEPLRYYPNGSTAGHLLGYIHSISPEEIQVAKEAGFNYTLNSLIGKSGVEKQYEEELRGIEGARRVEVDARNRPIRELITLEPKPGNNLYLTVDMNLQKVMEKSLNEVLENLQKGYPKAKVGSAVLLEVKTGKILAMASSPALNPDDWKGNISNELAAYYFPQVEQYDPLQPGAAMNRAIQNTYPPGSTYKPITGMAALERGGANPLAYEVNCQGKYWIAPYIRCTKVHGNVNYYSAMARSCNTYFQEMGRRATKDGLIHVSAEFGLGSKTGIDLPFERSGLLPTPEWKKEINAILTDRKYDNLRKKLEEKYEPLLVNSGNEQEKEELERLKKNEKSKLEAQYQIDYQFNTTWQPFDTFNMSIGQGASTYTVLQLANFTATIANGGDYMQPYIVERITSSTGKDLKTMQPVVTRKVDIKPESIAETRRAMHETTKPSGTAYHLFHHFPDNIQVGAKTGTSETGRIIDDAKKDFHGAFIAFAPVDDPQIAFAGVIEYGRSGGGSAGYIAQALFEQYFGVKDHLNQEDVETTEQLPSE
ncbi:MAG TPA: penicillin-binding transpeptidase domain-containing protein [Syntrophomonadaceae bacterium]|nr:penicillin-binding transpeptidase domain-containing protein [Syntrophomonadaceae bacterium]